MLLPITALALAVSLNVAKPVHQPCSTLLQVLCLILTSSSKHIKAMHAMGC